MLIAFWHFVLQSFPCIVSKNYKLRQPRTQDILDNAQAHRKSQFFRKTRISDLQSPYHQILKITVLNKKIKISRLFSNSLITILTKAQHSITLRLIYFDKNLPDICIKITTLIGERNSNPQFWSAPKYKQIPMQCCQTFEHEKVRLTHSKHENVRLWRPGEVLPGKKINKNKVTHSSRIFFRERKEENCDWRLYWHRNLTNVDNLLYIFILFLFYLYADDNTIGIGFLSSQKHG